MKNLYALFPFFTILLIMPVWGQTELPCLHDNIIQRQLELDPNALQEMQANELATTTFIEALNYARLNKAHDSTAQFIIPVVLHVFHNGDDGKITLAQAQSGLDVLNADIQGLNSDYSTVSPLFEGVKSAIDVQFCLASLDPDGNPTTGVNYYDDSLKMLNMGDLFAHAWDNFSYLNIYLPKYTSGEPSLFTAYAYYPNLAQTESNTDGVFYSSIRWGYGAHSELEDGQEWASVVTHEIGHWLNLRHTFNNGCDAPGDMVDDTPPTLGSGIELEGCNNNDESCGVSTNGENYMDYNHDCKKMFTQGQVDRMTAALYFDSRSNLWSLENLIATGCSSSFATVTTALTDELVTCYPNPTHEFIFFQFNAPPQFLTVYNAQGQVIFSSAEITQNYKLIVNQFEHGVYFYEVRFENNFKKGKFIVN